MKASQRSLQFALVYCQLRRRHLCFLLWMMRHEPDNPGVAVFTSNCTNAGSTSEAAPLPIRQRRLALRAWLVRVFAPSGGANAACSCQEARASLCWTKKKARCHSASKMMQSDTAFAVEGHHRKKQQKSRCPSPPFFWLQVAAPQK